jgi:DNA-binding Lrp family transcriptional regulator
MKNSRKSDRELALDIGISQPTVSRVRARLEKEGIIKEYTMIPDFAKLGFELMAITFSGFPKDLSNEELDELRKQSIELGEKNPTAILMALNGIGLRSSRVLITLHKNYSSYTKAMSLIKSVTNIDSSHVESFIIDLKNGGQHFQPLTLSAIAKYLMKTNEKQ